MNNLPTIQSTPMMPSDHEMMVFQTMAKHAVTSKMYKGIGDEAGLMAIMLSARELGIPPMAALNGGLNIISGKVEISARMMSSLIRKAGHSIQIKASTNNECTLVGQRGDNKDSMTCSFSMEDARMAGLVKEGGGWKKFPADMLYARCLSRLSRRLFADVIGVGYIEGEIKEATYEVIEALPEEPNKEEGLLKTFLEQFDKDDQLGWAKYIHQIKEKFNVSVEKIVEKYIADPAASQEKYKAWKQKQEQ